MCAAGCALIVFPELALTTFFPRWYMTEQAEIDAFFETEMPGAETRSLFEAASRYGMGFPLGYAELTQDGGRSHRYNSAILVDRSGRIVGKYRKVHLPGHAEFDPERAFQHLEKRYFEVGDLRRERKCKHQGDEHSDEDRFNIAFGCVSSILRSAPPSPAVPRLSVQVPTAVGVIYTPAAFA